MNTLLTGTVTFLFTDIEGSTKLALEHPGNWERLRTRHHDILKSAIASCNGYVFQVIGDAFCMTPFVGREREIAAVLGLMRNPDVRLITLTGAGGTGKTRLSLQVAADLLDEYEHGVWFVELASITDSDLVLAMIAAVLKVKESTGMPIEQALHNHLSNRHLLLVIDNFEQVVRAALVIGRLSAAAPRVKVLTSSREVLHLRGEHDYPVPPLGLPESSRKQTASVFAQYEAIALFILHAQAADPSFELNEGNASTVAEICTRLDGLPLAIELAAARSRLFKPAVMLEKLKSRLNLLTGGARDLPLRQQTIREFAFEKLCQGGELPDIQQAHANYMDVFLGKVRDAANGPAEVSWYAALDDELDNLRSVVEWALTHDQPALVFKAGNLYTYWDQRWIFGEPLGWLERAFAMDADEPQA